MTMWIKQRMSFEDALKLPKIIRPTFLLLSLLIASCGQNDSGYALGTLERERVVLTATANEVITNIPVKEGDQVEQGQLLLQLDSTIQQANVERLIAELGKAEAQLSLLQAGPRAEEINIAAARVKFSEADLKQAQKNYLRAKDVVKKKALGEADLDQAIAKRDEAEAKLAEMKAQLEMLRNGYRTEDIEQAKAQVQSLKAQLVIEEKRLKDLSIVATRSGIVDQIPWKLGERVTMGSQLIVLQSLNDPFARVYIPATHLNQFAVGQEIDILVGVEQQSFRGVVRVIRSAPAYTPHYALNQKERSHLMYLAEVELSGKTEHLPSGLPVQIPLP